MLGSRDKRKEGGRSEGARELTQRKLSPATVTIGT